MSLLAYDVEDGDNDGDHAQDEAQARPLRLTRVEGRRRPVVGGCGDDRRCGGEQRLLRGGAGHRLVLSADGHG